ncbi:alpha/beta fold hydrolase [Streptomyces sp. ACA25]|uniref:alpha/beta fold hydrolase n=1 Tax=Streptomyces sp. ACA25 TaxID=3022596 RepID=UPI002306EA2E|nr:alpha/beta fold hydrolase [Streptomyces sp. ACA25]MDB1090268.1 alpha/beta fold hydrolase [Streptomyces sp. ACA25]
MSEPTPPESFTQRSRLLDHLLPGYPGTEHWRRVPATGQHYLDLGAGDPVLFLHGNPSWSYAWRKVLPVLAPQVRCLAPDLPGLGMSPGPEVLPPDPAARYQMQLDHLEALHRHLVHEEQVPARGWTLVVHDWGGPLGIAWALRNPGVVARLVILNTIAFPWPQGYRLPFYLRWIRDYRPVAATVQATNIFARAVVRAGVTTPLSAAERRAHLWPSAHRNGRRAVTEFVRAIPRHATDEAWQLLEPSQDAPDPRNLPMFIGWGMRDPVFTPLVLSEWDRRYPHARIRRYPGSGHFVMEDAAPELAVHIRDFLRGSR